MMNGRMMEREGGLMVKEWRLIGPLPEGDLEAPCVECRERRIRPAVMALVEDVRASREMLTFRRCHLITLLQSQAKEKRKLYSEAWAALENANRHMRKSVNYDVENDKRTLDVLLNVFKRGSGAF